MLRAIAAACVVIAAACGLTEGESSSQLNASLEQPEHTAAITPSDVIVTGPFAWVERVRAASHGPFPEKASPGSIKPMPRSIMMCGDGALLVTAEEPIRRTLAREFILELWVMTIFPGDQRVLTMGDLHVEIVNGVLSLGIGNQILSGAKVALWMPFHVALVNDARHLALYVNGLRVAAADAWSLDAKQIVVGGGGLVKAPCGTHSLCGVIDNLRLSDIVHLWPQTVFSFDFDGEGRDRGPGGHSYTLSGFAAPVNSAPPVCH